MGERPAPALLRDRGPASWEVAADPVTVGASMNRADASNPSSGFDCISEPAKRVIVYSSNMTMNLPESYGVNRSLK